MPEKKDELLDEELISEDEEMDEDLEEEVSGDISKDEDKEPAQISESEDEASIAREAARMTSDVPVQLVAVLGKKTISMKELVEMKMGKVVDLARPANEVVDLVAGGKLVAKGELVEIDGKLGVRIVKMVR